MLEIEWEAIVDIIILLAPGVISSLIADGIQYIWGRLLAHMRRLQKDED